MALRSKKDRMQSGEEDTRRLVGIDSLAVRSWSSFKVPALREKKHLIGELRKCFMKIRANTEGVV